MARTLTYAQAISEALIQAMDLDKEIFIFGLGVDDNKGIFNTTKEAFVKFGSARVFDVPASEGALTGIAVGAALNGKRPVLVHARNDFMFLALDQMINNAAKWKYACAGKTSVPFLVRSIIGKGWGQGPIHSQSIQSIFAHFPGLFVAMPSSPYDVKGILMKSLQVNTPVVVLEHRALYDMKGEVPQEPYTVDFGQAKVLRSGEDVTVVATSLMVVEALKAADILKSEGVTLEVIDPVSLQPFDEVTVIESVKKTGRLICADTSWLRCGFASEVAAVVAEKAFKYLKAPIKRIGLPECPCPVSKVLEDEFYPDYQDIIRAAFDAMDRKIAGREFRHPEKVDTFTGPY